MENVVCLVRVQASCLHWLEHWLNISDYLLGKDSYFSISDIAYDLRKRN